MIGRGGSQLDAFRRTLRPCAGLQFLALCGGFVLWTNCILLMGQNVVLTGALGGRITDESGAVVPGAVVIVRNLATGVKESAETNHAGLYRFPALPPGSYSITASIKGFRDVQALVRVLVGNATSQNINCEWEPSADTIKVTGTTPLLRPTESSASTVIERSLIERIAAQRTAVTPTSRCSHRIPATTATPAW